MALADDDVSRAIGQLEGRVQSIEDRADRDFDDFRKALSDLTKKMEAMTASMSQAIETLKLAQARQFGGKATLTMLFSGAVALGGLIVSASHFFF